MGCLLGVILSGVLIVVFVLTAKRKGNRLARHAALLRRVDTAALDAGTLARWEAYSAQVRALNLLSDPELREVRSWPTR